MNIYNNSLDFNKTELLNKFVLEYILQNKDLEKYYSLFPTEDNFYLQIKNKKNNTNRKLLVNYFDNEYKNINKSLKQQENINLLNSSNTFTVCSAHQPNIFLGPLYTILKISQTIKISQHFTNDKYKIIPIFFMGNEDADFDELSFINIKNKTIKWQTKQRGAFGRLENEDFNFLISEIEKNIIGLKYSNEIINIIKNSYLTTNNITDATFKLINELFKEYGLLIITPDNKLLKNEFVDFIKKDILENTTEKYINNTIKDLKKSYKIQANPRNINFFYLKDKQRERIYYQNNKYYVLNTNLEFTTKEMEMEIINFPEKFSPNVFLRSLFQEFILPNIAFIGGGGEVSYWLELKKMFEYYKVDFPLIILRKSFVFIDENIKFKTESELEDIFLNDINWLNNISKNDLNKELNFNIDDYKKNISNEYNEISKKIVKKFPTLKLHLNALEHKHLDKLDALNKKIVKENKQNLINNIKNRNKLKEIFFPNNIFQERYENFIFYYAKYGNIFIYNIIESIKENPLKSEIKILKIIK